LRRRAVWDHGERSKEPPSKEESASFLQKRSKKLLSIGAQPVIRGTPQTGKSFLLLFFKKEGLPFP
jgi:hypothetical protein